MAHVAQNYDYSNTFARREYSYKLSKLLCIGYLTSNSDTNTHPSNGVTNVNNKQSLSDDEEDEYFCAPNKSKEKTDSEEPQDELVIKREFSFRRMFVNLLANML